MNAIILIGSINHQKKNKEKNKKKSFFMFSPMDDSSLPTLGLNGSSNSKRSAEQSKDSSKKHKIGPEQLKEDEVTDDSLSDADDETIQTLSSRLDDMSNKFGMIWTLLNQQRQNTIAPTPDQGKGL